MRAPSGMSFLVLALVLAFCAPTLALDCTDYSEYPRWLANVATPDAALDVVARDHFLFCACDEAGLQVVDVTDVYNPVVIGAVSLPGRATAIALAGDYVYVVAKDLGLHVVDVVDPTAPVLRGTVTTPGEARDVAVSGEIAYVADCLEGIAVIDVSQPTAPELILQLDDRAARHSVTTADDVLVSTSDYWFFVYDATDPRAPTLVGEYEMDVLSDESNWFPDATLRDDLLYFIYNNIWYDGWNYTYHYSSALRVFDLSVPSAPAPIGWKSLGSENSSKLLLSGDRVYVSGEGTDVGLCVLDVSVPSAPTLLHRLSTVGDVGGLALPTPGTTTPLCLANNPSYGNNGIRTCDVTRPELTYFPEVGASVGGCDVCVVSGLSASGTTAAVNVAVEDLQYPSFHVMIYSTAAAPVVEELGSRGWVYPNYGATPWRNALVGDLLFMGADYEDLSWLDISDPTALPDLVPVAGVTSVGRLLTVGTYVLAAKVSGDLAVVDAAAPGEPTLVATVPGLVIEDMAGDGDRVCYINGSQFGVLDVTDPTSPSVLGTLPLTYGNRVTMAGTVAAVACGPYYDWHVKILDISTPSTPAVVSTLATPAEPKDVAVVGSVLYVGCGWYGCLAVSLADPAHPVFHGAVATGASGLLFAQSDRVLSHGAGHLACLPLDCASPVPKIDVSALTVSVVSDSPTECPLVVRNLGLATLAYTATIADWREEHPPPAGIRGHTGWVTVQPDAGDLDPGESESLTLSFEPGGLPVGVYGATLHLASNDPAQPDVEVALELEVSAATGVPEIAHSFALFGNRPNPFRANTQIQFSLSQESRVRLAVYDTGGRLVRELVNEVRPAGPASVVWDGRGLRGRRAGAGVYFLRLEAGEFHANHKVVLLQ